MVERFVVDTFAVFMGVALAVCAVAAGTFFWARRKLRSLRARLLGSVAFGDVTVGSLATNARLNRRGVTTSIVRRQLRTAVEGALAAVRAAERAGAPICELGTLAADLDVAARGMDEAMASMGAAGVTPVVLNRATELISSAQALRAEAEHLLARAAVPGHAALLESLGTTERSSSSRQRRPSLLRWRLLAH